MENPDLFYITKLLMEIPQEIMGIFISFSCHALSVDVQTNQR